MPPKSLSAMNERERFFAGFILNKMWLDRYWCGEGKKQHLGHTSLDNIPKGRPKNEKGEILDVADDLRRLGYICIVPARKISMYALAGHPKSLQKV